MYRACLPSCSLGMSGLQEALSALGVNHGGDLTSRYRQPDPLPHPLHPSCTLCLLVVVWACSARLMVGQATTCQLDDNYTLS